MIPSSLSRIDLSTLSSHLRVIATTPAWPAVQKAIANLKSQGSKSDTFEEDFRCVQDYCDLLHRSNGIIANALICGLRAGRVSGVTDREQAILIGLDAIARAHRFSEKTDWEVAAILENIRKDQGLLGVSMIFNPEAGVEVWSSRLKAWKTALEDTLKFVEVSSVFDLNKIESAAWKSWLERADLFFHARRRLPEPKWNEILAVAAALPPATFLKLDLREMTVKDWSMALVEAIGRLGSPQKSPEWLPFAALLALGFRPVNWRDIMKWPAFFATVDAQELEQASRRAEKWQRRSTAAPSRAILIIRKTTGSLMDGWLPSTSTAAAAVTVDQALSFLNILNMAPPPPMLPSEKGIAFEMPLDQEAYATRILDFWHRKMGDTTPITYFAAEAISAEALSKMPKGHVVLAPKSVDDLFPAPTAR